MRWYHFCATTLQNCIQRIRVYALSPINTAGVSDVQHASKACSTRRTSWQEALVIKTLTGLPDFSVIATSFVPLPHFVLPTHSPPFFAGTNFASILHSLISTFFVFQAFLWVPFELFQAFHPMTIVENDDDTFDRGDTFLANPPRCPCSQHPEYPI